VLERRCGSKGSGDGAMGGGSCRTTAQTRMDKDFFYKATVPGKQNFLCFLSGEEQWGNSIYERSQKMSSSHQLGVERQEW